MENQDLKRKITATVCTTIALTLLLAAAVVLLLISSVLPAFVKYLMLACCAVLALAIIGMVRSKIAEIRALRLCAAPTVKETKKPAASKKSAVKDEKLSADELYNPVDNDIKPVAVQDAPPAKEAAASVAAEAPKQEVKHVEASAAPEKKPEVQEAKPRQNVSKPAPKPVQKTAEQPEKQAAVQAEQPVVHKVYAPPISWPSAEPSYKERLAAERMARERAAQEEARRIAIEKAAAEQAAREAMQKAAAERAARIAAEKAAAAQAAKRAEADAAARIASARAAAEERMRTAKAVQLQKQQEAAKQQEATSADTAQPSAVTPESTANGAVPFAWLNGMRTAEPDNAEWKKSDENK